MTQRITPQEWRKKEGLTLQATAEKLGILLKSGSISASYISLLERGERRPSFDVLDAYETLSRGVITTASFKSITP